MMRNKPRNEVNRGEMALVVIMNFPVAIVSSPGTEVTVAYDLHPLCSSGVATACSMPHTSPDGFRAAPQVGSL